MNIVLLDAAKIGSDISLKPLEKFGTLTVYSETISMEQARERTKDADIVVVDQFPINEESIGDASHLKYITMTSTGTNFVDFEYTNSRQIQVANIKGYSTFSVSQHTFALYLCLSEKLIAYNDYVKSGAYINDYANTSFSYTFHDLSGKTWGIVGMGQIGTQVARIAQAFGCKIIYHSPSGHAHNKEYPHVDFSDLLACADVISVHTPLTAATRKMFNYDAFRKMKQTAYFINVSRGGNVDEAGLARALEENQIAGAALDVLEQEPMSETCALRTFKDSTRLIITPHMAWASIESRTRAVEEVCLNIQSFLQGGSRNICTH